MCSHHTGKKMNICARNFFPLVRKRMRLFCIARRSLADGEQIGWRPDRLKILQQRDVVFLHPHKVVIVRIARANTTRERLAVRSKGPAHILAGCIDRITEVQRLLPFALWVLIGNPHIMSSPRAHVRTRTGNDQAFPVL